MSNNSHALTTRLCAAFALALGAMVLAGWALGIPSIVQIRPDWTPMVVNTAVGFVLSGLALLLATWKIRWCSRIAALLGVLIALLALEEWWVLFFDISPALSLPDLHRPLQPGYPHPGRMAPNTALCFLLFGAGLATLVRSHGMSIAVWIRSMAIAVLAIGLLGVVGYSLQLEYLYAWTGVTRMAVQTGIGMVVLGTGLWNLSRTRTGALQILEGKEVTAVYQAATLLLVLVAASAGIGGFAFLQSQVEKLSRDNLQNMARADIVLFDQLIQHRSVRAAIASADAELAAQLHALAHSPQDPAALAALGHWAVGLHAHGFSFVGAETAEHRWQFDGHSVQPTMTIALRGRYPDWLLWQDGFVLRRALPVRDASGVIGTLTTEQPLEALTAMTSAIKGLGATGETIVCGADATILHCFPARSRSSPFNTPRVIGGQPLPMDFAMRGKTGVIVALDYRQQRVLAAYGPIADTGLGLVVKREIADIYAPIRGQFQRIMLFLGALLLLGRWILRARLRPLLQAMEASRTQARMSSQRFEAAVESNLDSFFILEPVRDAAGDLQDLRYVVLNARAERTLGQAREDVIDRGMCELFPERRTDGTLDAFARAIKTGEPLVEERSAIAGSGELRWYHLQAVKLGDGLGVTVRDITRAKQATDQVRHEATHDPLTGLLNRAGFEQALGAALASARKNRHVVAVALLDLDGFKPINDSHGHAAGDKVLQHVASRLRDAIRPSDTVARLGGDEFVLVLPNISYPDGVAVVARKLIAQIALPLQVDEHAVAVTASVGISAFPHDGQDPANLLKCADLAMYRAKRAGRNGFAVYAATPD